jgi:hypothetical protein
VGKLVETAAQHFSFQVFAGISFLTPKTLPSYPNSCSRQCETAAFWFFGCNPLGRWLGGHSASFAQQFDALCVVLLAVRDVPAPTDFFSELVI